MNEQLNFESSRITSVEQDLTIDNILKRVSEIVLWRYYIGFSFEIGRPFNAPYRPDNNASFSLRFDSRERLMFKDFGRSDMYGDIFNYLQKTRHISFVESLEVVNEDFGLNLINKTNRIVLKQGEKVVKRKISDAEIAQLLKFEKKAQSQILIQAVVRKWEEDDLRYWSNYGISKETLDKYHVYPASKVFKNKYLIYSYNPTNPCYIYHFPKTNHVKCYMPFSPDKGRRFFGNVNNLQDIQGYYQCNIKEERENKLLILTKSMKDVMLLREYGIDAVALHGENHKFESDFIRHIRKYYKSKIISLYDRDCAGILGAKRLWKEHGIKAVFINKKWHCKDISDMFMTYGNDVVQDFLLSLYRIN